VRRYSSSSRSPAISSAGTVAIRRLRTRRTSSVASSAEHEPPTGLRNARERLELDGAFQQLGVGEDDGHARPFSPARRG
jgi:hypothetical protein